MGLSEYNVKYNNKIFKKTRAQSIKIIQNRILMISINYKIAIIEKTYISNVIMK